MIDANARLGDVEDPAVGGASPEEENEAGRLFRDLLNDADMFVPSTFAQFGGPFPDHTWVSSTGCKHRIDYIALP
eukprot:4832492-Alexandrium_andersonii.AAC.1